MADKELAAKLAKRLASTGEETEPQAEGVPPPPAPDLPKKIVENPYVPSDSSFSVDDLILKTLEVQEENNNYQKSLNSPGAVSPAAAPSPSKSPLPPKQTIRDWLQKDLPQPVNAVPKNPILPVEHHKLAAIPKKSSPEVDGSELERKLAAQRSKKAMEVVQEAQQVGDGGLSELERKLAAQRAKKPAEAALEEPPPATQPCSQEDTALPGPVELPQPGLPAPEPSVQAVWQDPAALSSTVVAPQPASIAPEPTVPAPSAPVSKEPAAIPSPVEAPLVCEATATSSALPEPPRKSSFEELEEQIQRELEEEERRKAEGPPAKPPRSMEQPPVTASPTAQKKTVPSPLLMEAIKAECGMKSPPPPTAPKPSTPTNSRPQSPVVTKKSIVSPLGLLCDPLMSIEQQSSSSPKPPSPKPIKKSFEENPEELEKLLERQRKINDGDTVPQFVNRKLSLYAEFSEFTRKQIKSLTETFKKYDEDGDGFIDFNELKRMMEKLGEAQTHIALKDIIKKVDEDLDGKINLREFFLLFRLAAKGELGCSEVFNQLAENIDVSKEGVLAAASFFQAKIAEQTKLSRFEEEIKQEQDERKREEEEKRIRREKFQQSRSLFH